MPPTSPYFLNPSAGFTPSAPTPSSPARPTVETGQTGGYLPMRQAPLPVQPYNIGSQQDQNPSTYGTAVRPTDQSNNPQAAWLQNMATFAGGNLAGSNALGNQPTGPVRRLVDVLGQQPFGEQNPMTLLMQALMQGNYGVQMPNQPTTPAPIYQPPTYTNPVWGAPGRPTGFNPMQTFPQ